MCLFNIFLFKFLYKKLKLNYLYNNDISDIGIKYLRFILSKLIKLITLDLWLIMCILLILIFFVIKLEIFELSIYDNDYLK